MTTPHTGSFAELLQQGVEDRFKTQQEAVDALKNAGIKISLRTFARYASGETTPPASKAEKILTFLGVPKMAELAGRTEGVVQIPEVELGAHGLRANGQVMQLGSALIGEQGGELRVLRLTPGHVLPSDLNSGDALFLRLMPPGGKPIGEMYTAGELASRGLYVVSLGRYAEIARLMEVGDGRVRVMSGLEGYEDEEIEVEASDLVVYAKAVRKLTIHRAF